MALVGLLRQRLRVPKPKKWRCESEHVSRNALLCLRRRDKGAGPQQDQQILCLTLTCASIWRHLVKQSKMSSRIPVRWAGEGAGVWECSVLDTCVMIQFVISLSTYTEKHLVPINGHSSNQGTTRPHHLCQGPPWGFRTCRLCL